MVGAMCALISLLLILLCSLGGQTQFVDSLERTLLNVTAGWKFRVSGLYVYLCPGQIVANDLFNGQNITVKIKMLDAFEETERMDVNNIQYMIVGVFLDLTCSLGFEFLEKCSSKEYLSGRQVWLLWGPEDLQHLEPLNISIDSQMMVVGPGEALRVFKVNYRASIQTKPPPVDPLLEASTQREIDFNIQKFPVEVGLVLEEKWQEGQTLDEMADREWHPWLTSKATRCTLPFYIGLRDSLNMTYELILYSGWGLDQGNGNWSGFLGGLQRREIEFSLHVIVLRRDRMKVADLFFNLQGSSSAFFFLQPRALGMKSALISPLSMMVWYLVLVGVLIHFVAFRIVAVFDHSQELHGWGSILIHILSNFSQQGYEDKMRLVASRGVDLTLLLFSYMIYLYYNAAILDSLLSPNPNTITTVEQIVNSDFHLIIHDAVFMRDFTSEEGFYGPKDAITLKMFKKFRDEGSDFRALRDGIKAVQSGRNVFFGDMIGLFAPVKQLLTESEICIGYYIRKIRPYVAGIATRKGSPYKEIINIKFNMMKEAGIVARDYEVWFDSPPQCYWRQEFASIALKACTAAYVVLWGGTVLGAAVFFTELITFKYKLGPIQ